MNNTELQKQIDALTQQQLALSTAFNRFNTLSTNSETLLKVTPNPESCTDSTFSLEDFVTRARNYKNYGRARGRWILSILTSEAALDSLKAATTKGLPAVAGIVEMIVEQAIRGGKELTKVDRQFIGSVVCYRMEANGYRKTGKQGFIPHKPFRKGQLYQQILN